MQKILANLLFACALFGIIGFIASLNAQSKTGMLVSVLCAAVGVIGLAVMAFIKRRKEPERSGSGCGCPPTTEKPRP